MDSSFMRTEQILEAFARIDANQSGTLSRAEVIKACRSDEAIRTLLGLPQEIRQEDGTRDTFEAVFQALDADDSKSIEPEEFVQFFSDLAAPPPSRNAGGGGGATSAASRSPPARRSPKDPRYAWVTTGGVRGPPYHPKQTGGSPTSPSEDETGTADHGQLSGWTLDEVPLLSRTIFNGALCLDGMRFPTAGDPASRALESYVPPMLRLHNRAGSWHNLNKGVSLSSVSGCVRPRIAPAVGRSVALRPCSARTHHACIAPRTYTPSYVHLCI
jgi:hypothetical protein